MSTRYRIWFKDKIYLTPSEKRELHEYLYSRLSMFAEYYPDLEPEKDSPLEDFVESYCYWGDEYNEGYIRELNEEKEDRLAAYLAHEFRVYRGEI